MPSVDIYPTAASNQLTAQWSDAQKVTYNIAGDAVLLADRASQFLYCREFSSGLPTDIAIDGIEVVVEAYTDAASGTTITAALTLNGIDVYPGTAAKKTSAIGTTPGTEYSLGASNDTWGRAWKRGEIHGVQQFGVRLERTDNDDTILRVAAVRITIYYTLLAYLQGERSQIPLVSPLPKVVEGTQVKSEEMNLLGDTLYNLEEAFLRLADNTNDIDAMGLPPGQPMGVLVQTFKGKAAAGPGQLFYSEVGTKYPTGNAAAEVTIVKSPTLYDVQRFEPPDLGFFNSESLYGVGWALRDGVYRSLFVTPTRFQIRRENGTLQYRFGFTAVDQDIFSGIKSVTNDGYDGSVVTSEGVVGQYFFDDGARLNNAEGASSFAERWDVSQAQAEVFHNWYASTSNQHTISMTAGTNSQRGWALAKNLTNVGEVDMMTELYSNDVSGVRRVGLVACVVGTRSSMSGYALLFGDKAGQTTEAGSGSLVKLTAFNLDGTYATTDSLANVVGGAEVSQLAQFTARTTVGNGNTPVLYRMNIVNAASNHIITVYESVDGGGTWTVVASHTEGGSAPLGRAGLIGVGTTTNAGGARYLFKNIYIRPLSFYSDIVVKIFAMSRANMVKP